MIINTESYINMQAHIYGLGLDENGKPLDISDGMAYQTLQRKRAAVLVQLLRNKTLDRRFILIHGPKSSGKTALSKGIIYELCSYNNNVVLLKSELNNATRDPLQTLSQALRKVLKLRITQENYVISGEVVKLSYDEPAPGVSGSVGSIILRTKHMSAIYGLGENIIKKMQKMEIQKGDVISIESATGIVLYLGQTDETKPKNYWPCPYGELALSRPIFYIVSMHEIDVYNNYCSSYEESNPVNYVEIKENLRTLVNKKVAEWLADGRAELIRGVVLIEDVRLMALKCFMYLQEAEHNFLPYVIMNCKEEYVEVLPFSHDFMRRVFKIETARHCNKAIRAILYLRCLNEKVTLGEKTFKLLKMFADINVQFAVQVMHMIKNVCQQMHYMPDLAQIYSGDNIIEVSEKFMNTLKKHNVELKFDCEVIYEQLKYSLTLNITRKV